MIAVYVGTYTDRSSRGVYRLGFDPQIGTLSDAVLVAEAVNPTFLARHPYRPVLYTVSETDTVGPDGHGAVIAFAVEADGSLTRVAEQPTGGAGPCFVSVDSRGTHLFVANYTGGSVAAFPLDAGGRIGPRSSLVRHAGSSVDPIRQRQPYAHAIVPAPNAPFVVAADLGIDRVLVYRVEDAPGGPALRAAGSAALPPGSGPRHLTFTPAGNTLFVINELASTVSTFAWDGARGTLQPRGEPLSTLPPDFSGVSTTAEIAMHANGRFVYASNRGHDSIAVLHWDADRLTRASVHPTQGRVPRHFAIDPGGTWLLAANQESDSIVVFRIDPHNGALTPTGAGADVPSPACIRFTA